MKKILISLLLLSVSVVGISQAFPCDPAQNGLAITPGTIAVGQTADIVFTIYNGGSNVGCSVPTGSVTVVLSLPSTGAGTPNYYQFQSFISPPGATSATGAFFDWQYLPAPDNVVIGTNRIPIPNGVGEANVTIRVLGTNITAPSGAISNLNIQVSSGSNNTANDFSSAPLIVTTLVATTALTDVKVKSTDCSAILNWYTSHEDAGTFFDVEYSPDGRYYVRIGTVAGKSATGSAYEYAYNQGNGMGFYRLKINKASGNSTYSKVVTSDVKCNAKKVFIYPNPVRSNEILNVNVAGYVGKVRGELFSAEGKLILTKQLQNGTNPISMTNLPQGSYIFKVYDDAKAVQNYKVVIVK